MDLNKMNLQTNRLKSSYTMDFFVAIYWMGKVLNSDKNMHLEMKVIQNKCQSDEEGNVKSRGTFKNVGFESMDL